MKHRMNTRFAAVVHADANCDDSGAPQTNRKGRSMSDTFHHSQYHLVSKKRRAEADQRRARREVRSDAQLRAEFNDLSEADFRGLSSRSEGRQS